MDFFENDEGYTSPSENGMSQFISKKGGSFLSKVSWTSRYHQDRKKKYSSQGGSVDEDLLSYLTDDKKQSGKVVDQLWLIAPEVSGYYSLTTNDGTESVSKFVVDTNSSIRELKTRTEKPLYLSLSEFICDIIDMLCGKPSSTFELKDGQFCKNPIVLIHGLTPCTISNYCDSFLTMGSVVFKLSHMHNHFFDTGSTSSSKVYTAFVNFVKDYLKVYKTIVMLKRSSIISLTMLKKFITPYFHQITMLYHVADKQFSGHPLVLLKNLNSLMLIHESPCLSDLLQSLFITCASAYSKYVSDWIYQGSLGSSFEFHIVRHKSPVSKDRRYWTHQFVQNEDVPLFLKDIQTPMFETGKVINLLYELQRKNLPLFFSDDQGTVLKFYMSHNEIIKLLNVFDEKMSQFLTHNSYMLKEIEETVRETTAKEDFVAHVDPSVVAQNYKDLECRLEAQKLEAFLQQQEKKQAELQQVQHFLQEARNVRLREAIDELFEEKRRKAYLEERERQELEKGYKLLRDHYGDFMDTIGIKGPPVSLPNQQAKVGEGQRCVSPSIGDSQVSLPVQGSGDCVSKEEEKQCSKEIFLSLPKEDDPSTDRNTPRLQAPPLFSSNKQLGSDDNSCDERVDCSKNEIPKLKSKDFKARSAAPVRLDLDMFEKPLMLSKSSSEDDSEQKPSNTECDAFLIQRFISLSIEIPLLYQNKAVDLYLLHHIIVTKELLRHVKALNDFLLLQNGQFGHFLSGMLIDMVQTRKLRKNEDVSSQIVPINDLLEEALSMVVNEDDMHFLKNHLSIVVVTEDKPTSAATTEDLEKKKKSTITSEFDVLNCLRLRHAVEWPLNIIFTKEFLEKYENIFLLQMKLVRAEILLGRVATAIKSKSGDAVQLKELNIYRYLMLQFVRMIRSYVNVTVIHTSWTELTASFPKMDSLKTIYTLLVHHIKTANSNCLLGEKTKRVMKLLTDQLIVIEAFCSKLDAVCRNINWSSGDKIGHTDYKILVRMYLVFKEIETVFSQVREKIGIDLIGIAYRKDGRRNT